MVAPTCPSYSQGIGLGKGVSQDGLEDDPARGQCRPHDPRGEDPGDAELPDQGMGYPLRRRVKKGTDDLAGREFGPAREQGQNHGGRTEENQEDEDEGPPHITPG